MMKNVLASLAVTIALSSSCSGFHFPAAQQITAFRPASATTTTALEARNVKKQSLGSILADVNGEDGDVKFSTPKPAKTSSPKKKKVTGGSSAAGTVSSDLASWAAKAGDNNADEASAATSKATTTAAFEKFEAEEVTNKKSARRVRQAERLKIDKTQLAAAKKVTDELNTVLNEGKNNLNEILGLIQQLIDQQAEESTGTLLNSLGGAKQSHTYRLAWVGSDDAICHIGTGQHKVPLARLQEIFLMLKGKNKLEMYEVISIFGPFPNIRNTLQGNCGVVGSTEAAAANWKIEWESMIDGLGKELLAGKEENERLVDLQIYFADPNAIVAIVPPAEGGMRSDPLEASGTNVLLFIRDDEMDEKLDSLRVV